MGPHLSGDDRLLIAKLHNAFLDFGEECLPETEELEYLDDREERGGEVCLKGVFQKDRHGFFDGGADELCCIPPKNAVAAMMSEVDCG